MKKRFKNAVAIILAASLITACGSANNGGSANNSGSGNTGNSGNATADAEYSDRAIELAKEYLTRHITPEDEIDEEIIGALIQELKATYDFEDGLTEIKVAVEDNSLIAQGKGWFEDLFGSEGIKVTIVEGAENYEEELMARGDLNFANRMLYPFLLNREKGADLVAVWATGRPSPEIVDVIVRSDSEFQTFQDLKGKTIATSASSCPYVVTEELILREGWEVGKDVNVINTQEYVNALLAGEVDAIIYHPTTPVNPILISGECRVLEVAPEDGVYVGGGGMRVIFTTRDFADSYPNITRAYLKLEEAIQAWEYIDTDAAAAIYESETRIPAENTIYWWNVGKETRFSWTDSKDELQKVTNDFYDWLIEYDVAFDGGADIENSFAEQYFD